MKRLICKAEEQQDQQDQQDQYLGQYVEIVNPKSKYIGYYGQIDKDKARSNQYVVSLYPQEYENRTKPHVLFIDQDDAYKWFRVVPPEEYQQW